ncbi:MAG: hypothetical protein WAY93_06210 [Atopobiaceae bacterium]|jgi:lysylphosphatidylglycerol synthetase-like protein (DUF2156 family)
MGDSSNGGPKMAGPRSKKAGMLVRRVQLLASILMLVAAFAISNISSMFAFDGFVCGISAILLFCARTTEKKRLESMSGYVRGEKKAENAFIVNGSFSFSICLIIAIVLLLLLLGQNGNISAAVGRGEKAYFVSELRTIWAWVLACLVAVLICVAAIVYSHVVFSKESGKALMDKKTAASVGVSFGILALLAGVTLVASSQKAEPEEEEDEDDEADQGETD